MMASFMVPILLQLAFYSVASSTSWSYLFQEDWPASCKGIQQSPIDIRTRETVRKSFPNIQFSDAIYQEKMATVTNTGRSVKVKFLNDNYSPTVCGGGLQGKYVLDSFHFHWRSEHSIDEYRYPLEGHFVHHSENYPNLESAMSHPGGVAVFAVFYNTLKTSIPSPAFSFVHEIEMVARRINKSLVSNNPITLADFLPQNLNDFYRYNGSLTTPNCNEGVIWTIFKKPQNIPVSQYKKLVDIRDEMGDRLRSNYRDPQAVNRRTVWESCGNDNIYY